MNTRRLKRLERRLHRRIPVIGGWLCRRAARELAADGSPEAIGSLAAVIPSDDAAVNETALNAINQISSQSCIDAVCEAWSSTRSRELAQLLVERKWSAVAPSSVRVLSALHIGKLDRLSNVDEQGVGPLMRACSDADETIAARGRQALQQLKKAEAKEAVCRLVIDQDSAIALEAAIKGQYAPRDERQRALFFFLTEQWDRYEGFDFDRSLLRSIYDASDAALRQRITEKLRTAGRIDFLTIIAGSDFRGRAMVMTPDETQFLVQMFEGNKEWAKLWTLVFELPFVWSTHIVQILARNGWKPEKPDEQAALGELIDLASGDMVTSIEEVSRLMPSAVRRAYARVRARINDVAFSPVAQVIAIGTGGRRVALWNYHRSFIERTFDGFDHSIGRVGFMPDGSLLCAERTNSSDPCAIYNIRDGKCSEIGAHNGSVTSLEPVNESCVLSTGRDYQIVMWDVEARRDVASETLEDWARAARVSPDLSKVALMCNGVRLVSLPQLKPLAETPGRWSGVHRAGAFAPDGESVIAGKFNGEVVVCRHNGKWLNTERVPLVRHNGQTQGVEVLSERKIIITAGSNGSVEFTSWENRAPIGSLHIPGERLTSLRVSPDGSFMAIGDSDSSMSLWDLRALDVPMMFARPLARSVPIGLAAVHVTMSVASLDQRMRQSLRFLECLLRHRFRYEIEIDEVPTIRAGEFDIEIEG